MRSTRATALLPAVALLAALTACGDGEDDDADVGSSAGSGAGSSASSSPPEDDGASEEPSDDSSRPEVDVVDRGSGERRDLAVPPEEGETYETEMTVRTRTRVGGAAAPSAPRISLPFTTVVESVEDDATTLVATYDEPTAQGDGAAARQVEAALAPFEGVVVRTTTGPDGAVDTEIEGADDLPPTMATSLQQSTTQATDLAPPFPDQPLGEGAEWIVTASSDAYGVEQEVRTTYTLDRLAGDRYEIGSEIVQTLQAGSLNGAEIDGGEGSGSGTMAGEVGAILPTSSSGSTRLVIDAAGSVGAQGPITIVSEFSLESRRVG